MALTPEDVVNKRFQPTKFREGYDQDEVDDYLDEVVVELRRLNQENEDLRQRLTIAESKLNEGASANTLHSQPVSPVPAPVAAYPEPVQMAVPVPQVQVPVQQVPVQQAPVDSDFDESSTTNLLQLARRLHEEHVREGAEKRDALVAEGHASAARIISEAEAKQRQQMGILDQERQSLESRIDELRTFEREYRAKLKSYIESQLRDLDTSSVSMPSVSSAPSFGNPSQTLPTNGSAAPTFQGFGA